MYACPPARQPRTCRQAWVSAEAYNEAPSPADPPGSGASILRQGWLGGACLLQARFAMRTFVASRPVYRTGTPDPHGENPDLAGFDPKHAPVLAGWISLETRGIPQIPRTREESLDVPSEIPHSCYTDWQCHGG